MAVNVKSLQARLHNIAKEQGIEFQALINRYGSEQFLERLSLSHQAERFIFKGGTLLTYLIHTERKTRDLDFSTAHQRGDLKDVQKVIESILKEEVDDGITWDEMKVTTLTHPKMGEPGARIVCPFRLGQMKGAVRIDIAFGDQADSERVLLSKIRYKGEPLAGSDFELLAYSKASIFAEKLHVALDRKGRNTRMKDYYDLFRLSKEKIEKTGLKTAIHNTFQKRGTAVETSLRFDQTEIESLQTYWTRYRAKEKLKDMPEKVEVVLKSINGLLAKVFDD